MFFLFSVVGCYINKLQFVSLTRMNINEKINYFINFFFVNYSLMFILVRPINCSLYQSVISRG